MGITAVIINRGSLLLVRRRRILLIMNPGIWTFVAGGKKRNESSKDAAYREILEETGLRKNELYMIAGKMNVEKINLKNKKAFCDDLYVFNSKSRRIKINIESSAFRWAKFSDIKNEKEYTNTFRDANAVGRIIKTGLKK